MPRARLSINTARVVEASAYQKNRDGDVVCIHCRCPVSGVRSYSRNDEDEHEQHIVPAYFRLAKGAVHGPRCRFNVEKTMQWFVGFSRAIRKIDRDALPILERIGQGYQAVFRLHILMEALRKAQYGLLPSRGTQRSQSASAEPAGTEYIRSPKVLRPYFRSAKGILALASRLKNKEVLAHWISLKYGDRTIPWDEFFFMPHEYRSLYELLEREKRNRSSSKYSHPVAVVVRANDKFKEPIPMNGEWRVASRFTPVTWEGERIALRLVLYFRDAQLARTIATQPYTLICGLPRMGSRKEPVEDRYNPSIDIAVSIVDSRQVCQYTRT